MASYPSLVNMPDPGCRARLCEVAGEMQPDLPAALASLLSGLPRPVRTAPHTEIRPAAARHQTTDPASLFLEREDGSGGAGAGLARGLSQAAAVWWREGLDGLLAVCSSTLGRTLLALWQMSASLRSSLHSSSALTGPELVCCYSNTRDWASAGVRCLAWHPHTTKLALGHQDDTVSVLGPSGSAQPTLKHSSMKNISSLAWRPLCSSQLAVGCQAGVLLWTVDPSLTVVRPGSSCLLQLSRPRHAPLTSLAWSPCGSLLATASPAHSALLVWCVETGRAEQLRRGGGAGCSLVRWSPDSARVFCATPGSVFRVWRSADWSCERWTVGRSGGWVAAAAWAPDSSHLLFATSEEAVLYCVAQEGEGAAVPVLDLSRVELANGEAAGGLVRDIQWDPTGQRVAISFTDTAYVAVLRAGRAAAGRLSPVGWLGGEPGRAPLCLQFQQSPAQRGAVLTLAWSDNNIQHFPLVFGAAEEELSGTETRPTFYAETLFTQ